MKKNSKTKQPNVLFVLSDQHRWSDLGAYGNQQVHSPNLDALAAKGVRFTNCISNCPVCVPARGTLMTGLHALAHGAAGNDLPLDLSKVQGFAEVMSKSGYHTGNIGKWHIAGVPREQHIPPGKGRLGFEEWKVGNCCHNYMHSHYYDEDGNRYEIEGYDAITHTDLAVDFMERNNDGEKPWSLMVSWGPPHDPYFAVPDEYLERYQDVEINMRPNVREPAVQFKDRKYWSIEELEAHHRGYYAHITALDEQFGRMMTVLEETGQLENTIVIYGSDHGDMIGSQGMTNKQLPWDESIRVPLIVYWEGHTLQGARDELIGLVDLPVSILGWLGLAYDQEVDGEDLHRLFIDPKATGPDAAYIYDLSACHQAAARGNVEWRGVRTERYTYARTLYDSGWLLYDNQEDPYQQNNLIDQPEYKALQDKLDHQMLDFVAKHDKWAHWDELCKQFGLEQEWEKSQVYFGQKIVKSP